MPTIVRLSDTLKICMYAGDHNPPHFHVLGPDFAFMVRLDTFQVLRGRATAESFAAAVAWAGNNRALLAQKWSELNDRD